MDAEWVKWALAFAVGILGFALGGGWPAKTYQAWSDAQLHKRLDSRYVHQVLYEADQRHNDMRHDRSDENNKTTRDIQAAINALVLSVERHTVAFEYWGTEMKELKEEVDRLREGRHDA